MIEAYYAAIQTGQDVTLIRSRKVPYHKSHAAAVKALGLAVKQGYYSGSLNKTQEVKCYVWPINEIVPKAELLSGLVRKSVEVVEL